jgi:hypothetical protein
MTLDELFQQLFDETNLVDNNDNRYQIKLGIKELHKNEYTLSNMLEVIKQYPDVWIYAPKREAVLSSPENTRKVLDIICQEFPWLARTEENLNILFSWLWRNRAAGGFTEYNVGVAVQVLGRSALESVNVTPPVIVVPPPPPLQFFDWSTVAALPDVPLTDPDGQPPPSWFLNKLSRDQIRSFVKREQESKRPAAQELRSDQLPLDSSPEVMRAATSAQMHDLVRRRQAAGLK